MKHFISLNIYGFVMIFSIQTQQYRVALIVGILMVALFFRILRQRYSSILELKKNKYNYYKGCKPIKKFKMKAMW